MIRKASANDSRSEDVRGRIYRGPKTLSIMPTFTCSAACTHCGTLSSPQDKTNLSHEHVLDGIREAYELGFEVVVFTGGEATLRRRELLEAISYATSLGLPTRLVTNAYWARSLEVAGSRLAELIDAGLTEINYSTGDEHVRYVPMDRVVFATIVAARRRFRVHVMIELRGERRVTKEGFLSHPLFDTLSDEERAVLTTAESPWMPLNPDVVESYPEGVATDMSNLPTRKGCPSVLATYTLQADGRVGACCGLGLRVIPELNVTTVGESDFLSKAISESEDDFMKLWIHYKGPEQILAWAAKHDSEIEWEGWYAHPCQSCQRIYHDPKVRKVIQENWKEVVPEIVEAAWLQEVGLVDALEGRRQTSAISSEDGAGRT
jgi:hypothetical protein